MLFGNVYNRNSVECGQQVMFTVTGTASFKIWVNKVPFLSSDNIIQLCSFD